MKDEKRSATGGKNRVQTLCVGVSVLALAAAGLMDGMQLLGLVPILLCGVPVTVDDVLHNLIRKRRLTAGVLVPVTVIAALCVKEYFAAGVIACIMQVIALFERSTMKKAHEGIERLMTLTPQTAHVLRDGVQEDVPVERIAEGDVLVVLAGETVPVDGVILSGQTTVDQSVMTGEPMPVDKAEGDSVISGTMNQFAVFTMKAACTSADSSMQRMVRLAEEIDTNKAPIIRTADRWGTVLAVAFLLLAALVGVLTRSADRAVAVLVVCCPVAFTMATPMAIMAGVANATKYGIVIRSGDVLERLSHVKKVAFDKTGTLTFGKPEVVAVRPVSGMPEEDLLTLAASAEQLSEHPLGKALVRSAQARALTLRTCEAFAVTAGLGVCATVSGHTLLLGKPELMRKSGYRIPDEAARESDRLGTEEGATCIFVLMDGKFIGFLAFADTLRPYSRTLITRLREMKYDTVLLTGDRKATADTIAAQLTMSEVHADLMPEDKLAEMERMERNNTHVLMVGDGINDSLALRAAYTSVAMGGVGSDIAVESADVVLVDDEVRKISYLLSLSTKVMKKIKTNIFLTMSINVWFALLAALGAISPVGGCLVHVFAALFVAVNSAALMTVWAID